MIVGIGADIVSVSRFSRWIESPELLQRFFHQDEIAYVNRAGSAQTAAGRFAAKEAFVKALGTGFRGISLKNICTINNGLGKPQMLLFSDAAQAFRASGAEKLHVTISHEKEFACAFVILERI